MRPTQTPPLCCTHLGKGGEVVECKAVAMGMEVRLLGCLIISGTLCLCVGCWLLLVNATAAAAATVAANNAVTAFLYIGFLGNNRKLERLY